MECSKIYILVKHRHQESARSGHKWGLMKSTIRKSKVKEMMKHLSQKQIMQSGMRNIIFRIEVEKEALIEEVAEVLAGEIIVDIEEADLIVVVEEEEVQEVIIHVIRVVVQVISAKTVREKMTLVTIVVRSDTLNLRASTRKIRLLECSAEISRQIENLHM